MVKLLFVGSNWEAQRTFEHLVKSNLYNIVGLLTQPDKPTGRKQEIKESEIKQFAKSVGIPVFHSENSPEKYQQILDSTQPELIICKSFGEIMPKFFIDYPKYKLINVHYSLLPEYRGAIPVQRAILDGKRETGLTFVQMVEKIDAGPILAQFPVEITDDDTNITVRENLLQLTIEHIDKVIKDWIEGNIQPVPQDESKATYCWKKEIAKPNAEIKWQQSSAEQIERMIRALIPWPVAWTTIQGLKVKIFKAQIIDSTGAGIDLEPGEIKGINKRLFIGTITPNKWIQVLEIQPEGGTRMTGESYLNGRDL